MDVWPRTRCRNTTGDQAILEVLYATGVSRAELHAMGAGSVVMAAVGNEAVLRDPIRVTGRERTVLFGAPAACTVELYLQRRRPVLEQRSGLALGPSPAEQGQGPTFPAVHRHRR